MIRIFVGNLPVSATDTSLRALFATHGTVEMTELIMDRTTGRHRGFGFVQMPDADALRAIDNLHGREFDGRSLKVNEAPEPSVASRGRRRNR